MRVTRVVGIWFPDQEKRKRRAKGETEEGSEGEGVENKGREGERKEGEGGEGRGEEGGRGEKLISKKRSIPAGLSLPEVLSSTSFLPCQLSSAS